MALIKIDGKAKFTGKTIFDAGYRPTDSDAISYIAAVEAADGASLEDPIKQAYENFILGCKSDGIWASLKASCILAGARTLNGALVPLAGTAPTNNNFVSADYDRETGLLGNGSTKYLNSNRAGNADPQNNFHAFAWLPSQTFAYENVARQLIASVGNSWVGYNMNSNAYFLRARQSASTTKSFSASRQINTVGISRSNSSAITTRVDGVNNNFSVASATAGSPAFFVLAANTGSTASQHCPARLSFYSIGEHLDLALLDTRVSALMTAINAAI